MNRTLQKILAAAGLLAIAAGAAGCNLPTAPATPSPIPPGSFTATSPAATAVPATAVPATSVPATPVPGGGTAEVITAQNAAQLDSVATNLAEWPYELLWVAPGVTVPGASAPAPNLLVRGEKNLYPLVVAPSGVSLGQPLPLPLAGHQPVFYAPGLTSMAASDGNQVTIYDLAGNPLHALNDPAAYGAVYSQDGKTLVVSSSNELAVSVYDVASGQRTARLTGFETAAPVYDGGPVPGGKLIYWHSRATLQFQDIASGQLGSKLSFQDFIGPILFSPDGTRVTLEAGNMMYIYSVPEAQEIAKLELSTPSSVLVLSPDGKLLVGSYGQGLQIWDAATLAPITTLSAGANTTAVSISPDGRYIASGHEGNLLRVWKVGAFIGAQP